MTDHSNTAGRRSRRRLAIWLAFGALGLLTGAVWATGFATFSGGTNGTSSASPIVTPASPTTSNPLSSAATADGTAWNVNWSGDWGSTSAYWFFQVDLTGQSASNHYNIAMLLTNGSAMSGATNKWQTLQLKTELRPAAGATCAASDFGSSGGDARVFSFDSNDSGVYWNDGDADVTADGGIVGGGTHPYCIGIEAAAPPYDGTGTFLRAASTTPPDVYPEFVTTVNRVQ